MCKYVGKGDPPQDCDWPWCGCDEAATKVIEAIQENDCLIIPRSVIEKVLWFDWSENDDDAVAAIEALRYAVETLNPKLET